jgi:hypothetical protein
MRVFDVEMRSGKSHYAGTTGCRKSPLIWPFEAPCGAMFDTCQIRECAHDSKYQQDELVSRFRRRWRSRWVGWLVGSIFIERFDSEGILVPPIYFSSSRNTSSSSGNTGISIRLSFQGIWSRTRSGAAEWVVVVEGRMQTELIHFLLFVSVSTRRERSNISSGKMVTCQIKMSFALNISLPPPLYLFTYHYLRTSLCSLLKKELRM